MTYLVLESRDRGEPMSLLTASEGGIYPRFGYGVASEKASLAVSKSITAFRTAPTVGRLRMVEPAAGVEIARPLFDQVRLVRAGAVSRPDAWWVDEWAPKEWIDPRHRFDVAYEVDGKVEGYAIYAIDGEWTDGYTKKFVGVREILAITDRAEHALWNYLFSIDQTVEVRAWNTPVDSPLPWLLTDAREVRTINRRDWLWLRPIDTAALLAARSYGAHDELVIEVADRFLDLEETVGTFLVTGTPSGSSCARTDREPDLTLDADALGAILLGGFAPTVLVRADRIRVRDDGVAQRADAMFRAERLPFGFTWF
jgi:predicted acetyltransferase